MSWPADDEEGTDEYPAEYWHGFGDGIISGLRRAERVLHEMGYVESAAALHRMTDAYSADPDGDD